MKRLILFLLVFTTISGLQDLFGQAPWPLVDQPTAMDRLDNAFQNSKVSMGTLTQGTLDWDKAYRKTDMYIRAIDALNSGKSVAEAASGAHTVAYSGFSVVPMGFPGKVEKIDALDGLYLLLKL